jgi:hypothetical protein
MSWLAPIEASFVGRSRVRRQLTRASIAAALVAVLGTGTWAFFDQRRQRIEAVATSISLQLELPEGEVERRDAEALIMLAGASGDERRAFVDELFKRSSLADRFARNPAAVTRALVGLDPAARREIIAHTFGPGSVTPDEADGRYARAPLGIELATPAATEVVLAAIQESEGRLFVHPDIPSYRADPLRARGRAFAELAAGLTAEQARQAIGAMLAAIQGETHPSALGPLSQGLAALPVELTPDQAGQALDAILAEMERTWDSDAPRAFGEGLAALAADLNPYQAGQALEAVLAKMEGGSSREPPRSRRY